MEFVKLFEPIVINEKLEVKNRIVLPALGLAYTQDYSFSERYKGFYRERAHGGVGLMTIGPIAVDKVGSAPPIVQLFDDRQIERGRHVPVQQSILVKKGPHGVHAVDLPLVSFGRPESGRLHETVQPDTSEPRSGSAELQPLQGEVHAQIDRRSLRDARDRVRSVLPRPVALLRQILRQPRTREVFAHQVAVSGQGPL